MATAIHNSHAALAPSFLPKDGTARLIGFAMLAIAGSIVLWVSAKTHVPFYPVPMTLQTLAIVVIAALYGFRLGLATMALYLLEGAFGLPVFSGTPERGIGFAYMVGPTAGYLVGFIVATGFVGWFAERGADKSPAKLFVIMAIGAMLVLGMGFAYLSSVIGAEAAWTAGVAPFLLGDAVKVAIAALLVPAAGKLLQR